MDSLAIIVLCLKLNEPWPKSLFCFFCLFLPIFAPCRWWVEFNYFCLIHVQNRQNFSFKWGNIFPSTQYLFLSTHNIFQVSNTFLSFFLTHTFVIFSLAICHLPPRRPPLANLANLVVVAVIFSTLVLVPLWSRGFYEVSQW